MIERDVVVLGEFVDINSPLLGGRRSTVQTRTTRLSRTTSALEGMRAAATIRCNLRTLVCHRLANIQDDSSPMHEDSMGVVVIRADE